MMGSTAPLIPSIEMASYPLAAAPYVPTVRVGYTLISPPTGSSSTGHDTGSARLIVKVLEKLNEQDSEDLLRLVVGLDHSNLRTLVSALECQASYLKAERKKKTVTIMNRNVAFLEFARGMSNLAGD